MQGVVVELIRELMQTQGMSVRKISARIAQEQGGSVLGYTQQINRILNDPDYDPTFSTVQKVLLALNFSLWQNSPAATVNFSEAAGLEARLNQLSHEVSELKGVVNSLSMAIAQLTSTNPSVNSWQVAESQEENLG